MPVRTVHPRLNDSVGQAGGQTLCSLWPFFQTEPLPYFRTILSFLSLVYFSQNVYRMKLHLTTIFTALAFINGAAQNIGIGTTTPLSKLHVFGGASGNITPYSPLVVESNSHTYINLLSPNNFETSILFGKAIDAASGGIMYNSLNTPNGLQFRTNGNLTRMLIRNNGDVGIGIGETVPGATLDVIRGTNDGGTAIFRGTNNISHFNHSINENTYIRAGKNNGFVVLNDIPGGRVGIGTSSPNAPLGFPAALGKKITLYPGGTGDVGFAVQGNLLQIYTDLPNADVAFGYDQGGVFTERFRMKGTGAFSVNGNTGTSGQYLQSNGDNAVPTWTNPTNLLYNNTVLLLNNIQTEVNSSAWINLPGLNHTFTVSGNAKVVIMFSIFLATGICAGCGNTTFYIDINLDGSLARRYVEVVPNGVTHSFAGSTMLAVGAGTHTIQFLGSRGGSNGYMGHNFQVSNAVLQIIPQ